MDVVCCSLEANKRHGTTVVGSLMSLPQPQPKPRSPLPVARYSTYQLDIALLFPTPRHWYYFYTYATKFRQLLRQVHPDAGAAVDATARLFHMQCKALLACDAWIPPLNIFRRLPSIMFVTAARLLFAAGGHHVHWAALPHAVPWLKRWCRSPAMLVRHVVETLPEDVSESLRVSIPGMCTWTAKALEFVAVVPQPDVRSSDQASDSLSPTTQCTPCTQHTKHNYEDREDQKDLEDLEDLEDPVHRATSGKRTHAAAAAAATAEMAVDPGIGPNKRQRILGDSMHASGVVACSPGNAAEACLAVLRELLEQYGMDTALPRPEVLAAQAMSHDLPAGYPRFLMKPASMAAAEASAAPVTWEVITLPHVARQCRCPLMPITSLAQACTTMLAQDVPTGVCGWEPPRPMFLPHVAAAMQQCPLTSLLGEHCAFPWEQQAAYASLLQSWLSGGFGTGFTQYAVEGLAEKPKGILLDRRPCFVPGSRVPFQQSQLSVSSFARPFPLMMREATYVHTRHMKRVVSRQAYERHFCDPQAAAYTAGPSTALPTLKPVVSMVPSFKAPSVIPSVPSATPSVPCLVGTFSEWHALDLVPDPATVLSHIREYQAQVLLDARAIAMGSPLKPPHAMDPASVHIQVTEPGAPF